VPEFIDSVFTKTSPKRSFSVIQNERFGLVFAKTGSIILGTGTNKVRITWDVGLVMSFVFLRKVLQYHQVRKARGEEDLIACD
jgi:hypothetical protein